MTLSGGIQSGKIAMPLDTGSVAPAKFAAVEANDNPVTAPPKTHSAEALVLTHGAHLGEGLRAAREARELSLQDVSDSTKIHPKILDALEALDMGRLPSRPFAIGFVRSYANFLGVDAERAIARFKADAPDANEAFRPPVGVSDDGDPRLGLIAVGAALVLGAIVVWNVAQRAMADKEPQSAPVIASAPMVKAVPSGPVTLGEALPAPAESTVPKPYVTPGLEQADNATGPILDPTKPLQLGDAMPELRPSNPNAPVYGAPPEQASIISLRARKSVALIVKTADGSAIFTRVLSGGETYRAPAVGGLTFDVSDPTGVDVFRSGEFIGQLPAMLVPASKLGGDPAKVAPAPKTAAAAPTAAAPTPAAPTAKVVAPAPKAAAPAPAKPAETKPAN
jgi:cytoskeleton protein RodZ